ncbi:unnamed protein product [Bursaphelenchus xylophilus]|uniref:Serpentine receptor class gamma n=1 Tax=Bursaphelenchus xylophilus TaxID=6326 RepID=A0A1I7S6B4_BURXY|nr:unnamed protein product [Bursaphelenchus xylophilus]CAG9128171.1 unnamed protein product [Bursaphelenchus xylophilus]
MFWFETAEVCLCSFPLFILYIRVLYVLARRRASFASHFYTIMLVGGVFDVLGCSFYLVLIRLVNTDWFVNNIMSSVMKKFTFYGTPVIYLEYHCMYTAQISPLVMAFNRMCSLCFPLRYDRIWKHWKPILFVCYVILPFSFAWYILLNRSGFTFDVTPLWFNYSGYDYDHTYTFGIMDAVVTLYLSLGCAVLAFCLNLVNVCMLIRHKMKGYVTGKREANLVICSTVIFFVQCCVVLGQHIYMSGAFNIYVTLRFIIPPTLEAQFVFPALVIVLSIGSLREVVFSPLFNSRPIITFSNFQSNSITPIEAFESIVVPNNAVAAYNNRSV